MLLIVVALAYLGSRSEKPVPSPLPEPAKVTVENDSVDTRKPPTRLPQATATPNETAIAPSQDPEPAMVIEDTGTALSLLKSPAKPASGLARVNANTLNVRGIPDPGGTKLGTLTRGTVVRVFETRGGWARVSDTRGGLKGWVSLNYLMALTLQEQQQPVLAKPKPKPVAAKPLFNRSAVVKEIIGASIASYPGRCPCPYFTDRAGRRCGGRSAYSRAGGYAPLCYPEDVTDAMVREWVSR